MTVFQIHCRFLVLFICLFLESITKDSYCFNNTQTKILNLINFNKLRIVFKEQFWENLILPK